MVGCPCDTTAPSDGNPDVARRRRGRTGADSRHASGQPTSQGEVGPLTTGVDVASWQGEPNWGAVRGAGVEFAYVKLTEGTGYLNPNRDSQFR
ncbi:GH25 family lysozyme, partial [Streptoalloteichus tenebrarius]|uniref:GH25 family lysozyme n=1 Tax=Streptoalloteichus tenebrarius (strain ATCC 17920 / DSM 40477 / JCM 4838 / CBS 697.72 / NBRC 16177 / NCIMB 11028 / NRRL B-12390 / A12253. 1 / ISP 5477) TaxID=1933 RepID=UPI0035E72C96